VTHRITSPSRRASTNENGASTSPTTSSTVNSGRAHRRVLRRCSCRSCRLSTRAPESARHEDATHARAVEPTACVGGADVLNSDRRGCGRSCGSRRAARSLGVSW
jgi:hypothetical protein